METKPALFFLPSASMLQQILAAERESFPTLALFSIPDAFNRWIRSSHWRVGSDFCKTWILQAAA